MPTRLLREGINDSEAVNSLSLGAEVFYRRLMSVADDHGLYSANPMLLLGKVFALRMDEVTIDQIGGWLGECESAGLLRIYTVDGKTFLQIRNFGQKARSAPKHPLPPEQSATPEQPPTGAHEPPPDASDGERLQTSVSNCSQTADNREQMRALCVCGCECGDGCECEDECVRNERECEAGSASAGADGPGSQRPEPDQPAEAPPAAETAIAVTPEPDPPPSPPPKDPKQDPTPYREIVRAFNEVVAQREVTWPAVQKKTKARCDAMRARWRTDAGRDVAAFADLFRRAADSDFLSGRNGRWSGCNFDWFLKPANWAKVVEGTYDQNRNQTRKTA